MAAFVYGARARPEDINLDGQRVHVDSQLEKKVLIALVEQHGFAGKWQRRQDGIMAKDRLYTPDIELSVAYGNGTKSIRALVEVKPNLEAFKDSIAERMRIVAGHYKTDMLYLYADAERMWYQIPIDARGTLMALAGPPQPGATQIAKLYSPWTRKSQVRIYNNTYRQAEDRHKKAGFSVLKAAAAILEGLMSAIVPTTSSPAKQRYRRRK